MSRFRSVALFVMLASVCCMEAQKRVSDLPEVLVEAKKNSVLHILAYMREYSTLSGYSDTITLFREKMVDFMIPAGDERGFKGWRSPRVLNSRSYYRFSDSNGLDSVSDRCNHHFTWSDWIGMIHRTKLPASLSEKLAGMDTIAGKYSAAEIWAREGDAVTIDINVLASPESRKWVPGVSSFFRNDNVDFDKFKMHIVCDNVLGDAVTPRDGIKGLPGPDHMDFHLHIPPDLHIFIGYAPRTVPMLRKILSFPRRIGGRLFRKDVI